VKKITLRRLQEKEAETNDPQIFDPDSYEAYYEEDTSGPEENDVIVNRFIWHREKSNQNIKDTGKNKGVFSFYYARHTYDDKYSYYIPKRKNRKQTLPDRYHLVGQLPDDNILLTIDVEGRNKKQKVYKNYLCSFCKWSRN
jgi:hypothetical protein